MKEKGFAHLLIIFTVLVVFILGIAGFAISKNKKNEEWLQKEGEKVKNNIFNKGGKQENFSLASDLPPCPSDTSTLFTKPFLEGDKPDYIIPLGNSSQSGHVVPTDHVYPGNFVYQPDVPIYAPGNLTLIWVENKQIYNANTDGEIAADYQLNFAPCRGLNLAFIHLTKLSEKLEKSLTDKANLRCDSQKIEYGTRNRVPVYYRTCHPRFNNVKLEPGELIGYFGYNDKDKPQDHFDIGIYDYNRPTLGFINPERYYDDTLHTTCFADYYIPELKARYMEKFGIGNGRDENPQKLVRRTGEPLCGQIMYDVAGTASGDWFRKPIDNVGITDQDALVLIHDNFDGSLGKVSMANVTSFTFTPMHSGQINREFSEVEKDGKIYCYEYNQRDFELDKWNKVILELVDDTHLKAEYQNGRCGENEDFKTPVNYQR